jgi:hypothetical protein
VLQTLTAWKRAGPHPAQVRNGIRTLQSEKKQRRDQRRPGEAPRGAQF